MTHKFDGTSHVFACDNCGEVAGHDPDEQKARAAAMKREGWTWRHPHWQLFCPSCGLPEDREHVGNCEKCGTPYVWCTCKGELGMNDYGWIWLAGRIKRHYFRGLWSLCGKAALLGPPPVDLPKIANNDDPTNCQACRKKLKKLESKA